MDGWCVSCRQTADRPARGILLGVWNSHSLSVCPAAKHKCVYVHACAHTTLFYYHCLWLANFETFYNHSHPSLYNTIAEDMTNKKEIKKWMNNWGYLGSPVRCSQNSTVCRSWWIMKTLFSRCISLHYFQNATKACVCGVRYYADHECSSRQVQFSRLDTVNVGRSPGCWIMDQRRTPAQPNAVWSDVTVISADCCGPQRADRPHYRLVHHTPGDTKHTSSNALTGTRLF